MSAPLAYRPVCALARGGMATVEVAVRRSGLGHRRLYALKRPHAHLRDDAGFRAMFLDEARLASLVQHPNVVAVVDAGEDQDGLFLVMDHIDGLTAAALLEKATVPLPLALALTVAAQAARGLHAAHELRTPEGQPLGLIHRDVSPQNIIVGADGLVRVTDFGVAKALGSANQTATGVVKGNFGYLAPECLRHEPVDRRADLFALGVVLFELLAGARLYPAREHDTATRILTEPPPDVLDRRPDTPDDVVALLFDLLAKESERRPPTAEAVALRLEAALADVVAEQGAFDLRAWLATNHSAELSARRERIRVALEHPPPAKSAWPARLAIATALLALTGTAAVQICTPSAGHGLRGEYFSDAFLRSRVHTRIDNEIFFTWSGKSPAPGLNATAYSVRWTGHLHVSANSDRELCVRSDDGARLWLNDTLAIDDWNEHGAHLACATRPLPAGSTTPVRLEYFQSHQDALIELLWKPPGPGQAVPIPPAALSPR